MQNSPTRRSVTAGLALGAISLAALRVGTASAQAKSVKIAMIAPLSGPWARQGQLLRQGADMAVEEFNSQGGIRSLGGAKLEIIYADAGDNTEKAKHAAQRLLSDHPDLVGGSGAWLSSFTLAVTEVTERAELPMLTLSYSDAITNRGFKYVFQTSPTADKQAKEALDATMKLAETATGKKPQTMGIVMDHTAAPGSFVKPMREGGLDKPGAADRRKVAEAMHAIDTTEGPAKYYVGDRLKFDEAGRNVGAQLVFVQWHDGVPVTVAPPKSAMAEVFWPKR